MKRLIVTLLVIMISGCASSLLDDTSRLDPVVLPRIDDLPAPLSLPTRQVSSYHYAQSGAQFSTSVLMPQRVSILGDEARFTPYWHEAHLVPGWQAAWALYEFTLLEPEGSGCLGNSWSYPPQQPTALWLGLGNRQQNQWEWHNVEPGELLPISDFAPYLGSTDTLWVVVVLLDVGEFDLSWLWLEGETGAPQIVGVDPLEGVTGTEVMFSAAVWGQPPLDYAWAFGGGADPASSSESTPTVVLAAVAAYNGTLTVTNGDGEDSCGVNYEVKPWPDTLWIFPAPRDADWAGIVGSGTVEDKYVVTSTNPPFNTDYQLYFSLAASSQPNGAGLAINPAALFWDAFPPFIVEDPAWLLPGTFRATQFANGYIYAETPSSVQSNQLYIIGDP